MTVAHSGSLAVLLALTATACVGVIGGADDGPSSGGSQSGGTNSGATPLTLGQAPLRRLNHTEYDNSVRDLFGVDGSPSSAWPSDASDSGFDNDVSGQGATAELIEQMARSAEAVATQAATNLGQLMPCAADASADPKACAASFIDKYAHRAYRRPLTDADRTRLNSVFAWGFQREGIATGLRLVIAAILESPHFLYRPEVGAAGAAPSGPGILLTDHEIATRLSFVLTNSIPDQALLDAADAGQVHTSEQIRAHAERLLVTPAGRATVDSFFRQWLPFAQLATATKDASLFPQYDDETRSGMYDGMKAFVEHVVFDSPAGDVNELMTANYAFVNAKTAPLYGIDGVTGTALQQATATGPRAGMLTQVGLLAALAKAGETAPIARGKFVYKQLFCGEVAPPPANLGNAGIPPPPDPKLTTRERYSQHRDNPVCASCHALLDPPGFALENYDAIGRYRAIENGQPVDASAQITIGRQVVSVNGAVDLAKFAATSPQFHACAANKWLTYTFGRTLGKDDQSAVDDVVVALQGGSGKIRDMLIAATQTYSFSHLLPAIDGGQCQ